MTLVEFPHISITPDDRSLEITKRVEDCMSVYFKLDRKSRRLKSPIIEQIQSGLGTIEIDRSAFRSDTQLWHWVNNACQKTVEAYLKIALTNFCNNPLGKNVKVNLK